MHTFVGSVQPWTRCKTSENCGSRNELTCGRVCVRAWRNSATLFPTETTSYVYHYLPRRGSSRTRTAADKRHCKGLRVDRCAAFISRPRDPPSLRVLYCHYVFDDQRREFETIICYLQSIGEFIGIGEVIEILEGKRPIKHNLFYLSFDDGFENVVTNALLREHGVPAAFFVPTAIISAPPETLEKYCRAIMNYPSIIEIRSSRSLLGRTWKKRRSLGSKSHRTLAVMPVFPNFPHQRWQSRTRSLDPRRTWNGGWAVIAITSPGHTDELLMPMRNHSTQLRRAGYRACFGAFRGRVIPKATDRFRTLRHHFEVQWPFSHVKCFAHGAMEG
jgi:hypothetical protein